MDYILLNHSFISGHLGYFHIFAIVNNTALNMAAQISLQCPIFKLLGCILRNGIAGSYGGSIFNF